ncbi:MAG: UDP-N-acetylmuramoyl-L-alanyl-D-glutamate--2,6-diaminopimelate ligase [Bacteroidetes bacterium]|nr:UDP-N-acetylmuramoyl-L-alanyl-D-glutamate--2,6-diaminopimelate ligase [Bacteroidota bacterium]
MISFSDPLEIIGPVDDPVNSICSDSRKVKEGSLFIAVRGITSDGHLFISQAITLGARFILCEETPSEIAENITYIKVANSAVALGNIAAAYYDHPSSKMNLVGVTGTNGKTTIVTLLYQLFQSLGYKTGLLSTIHNRINETIIPSTHTTPDPIQINELLADMIANGCTHCFMEVSSHAADQRRIAGLTFRGGIFTNITHDHLDYHKTFDAYLKAKKSFFDGLPEDAFSLVNKDDRNGMVMVQNTKSRIFSYSLKSTADFKCRIIENQFQGLQLNIDSFNCWFKLIGSFNAYNLLAVYAVAVLLHQDKSEILIRLSNIEPVKGRFNPVISENNITAIVDYAHTPDALLNVLSTIQSIRMHHEKVITLIGAGGNRDAAKRPLMAKIACSMSDRVILTSDNPRFEEPEAIIEEMKKGVDPEEEIKVLVIVNRKEAIKTACALAQPGDIILVAGKGHENYQEIKGVKYPFDDMEILNETLVIINPHQ